MKYRIKEYYHEGNKWKEERIPIKPEKKKKRNPFVIGSDARPWKGLFGFKKWLIK
jgi:hypothetical protein|tara:strand:- start:351 stop:515 length:165 start_codon:yes stop_codon:yes gene_type:complete